MQLEISLINESIKDNYLVGRVELCLYTHTQLPSLALSTLMINYLWNKTVKVLILYGVLLYFAMSWYRLGGSDHTWIYIPTAIVSLKKACIILQIIMFPSGVNRLWSQVSAIYDHFPLWCQSDANTTCFYTRLFHSVILCWTRSHIYNHLKQECGHASFALCGQETREAGVGEIQRNR